MPIVLILLLSIFPAEVQAREKLVFTTFPDSDTPNIVIAQTIVSEAYRRLGIDVEIRYLPGRRATIKADSGEVDGLLFHGPNLGHTYTNLVQINTPVFHSELVAFAKDDDNQSIGDWEQLKKHTLGFVRGFFLVEDRTKGAKVEMFNDQEDLFLMLSYGKIDFAIDTYVTGQFTIKKLGLKGVVKMNPTLENFSSFHYLNKNNKILAPKVEAVLHEMEEEGFIQEVRNNVLKKLVGED